MEKQVQKQRHLFSAALAPFLEKLGLHESSQGTELG